MPKTWFLSVASIASIVFCIILFSQLVSSAIPKPEPGYVLLVMDATRESLEERFKPKPFDPSPPEEFECVRDFTSKYAGVTYDIDSTIAEVAKERANSAKEEKLLREAICTIIRKESNGRVNAVGGVKECGPGQVNPSVWKDWKFPRGKMNFYDSYAESFKDGKEDPRSCFNPKNNIDAVSTIFLRNYRASDNNLFTAFLRYNGSGPAAHAYAKRAIKEIQRVRQDNRG